MCYRGDHLPTSHRYETLQEAALKAATGPAPWAKGEAWIKILPTEPGVRPLVTGGQGTRASLAPCHPLPFPGLTCPEFRGHEATFHHAKPICHVLEPPFHVI